MGTIGGSFTDNNGDPLPIPGWAIPWHSDRRRAGYTHALRPFLISSNSLSPDGTFGQIFTQELTVTRVRGVLFPNQAACCWR